MPILRLNPNVVTSSSGFTGATVANLEASDAVYATSDAPAGGTILVQIADAPGDYGSLNSLTLSVRGRTSAAASRPKSFLLELLNGAGTVLHTFTTGSLSTTNATYTSGTFTPTLSAADITALQLRITVQEAGGMADSVSSWVDHLYTDIDYAVAAVPETITGSGTSSNLAQTSAGAGDRSVTGSGAGTAGTQTSAGAGIRASTGFGAGVPSPQVSIGTGSRVISGAGASGAAAQQAVGAGIRAATGSGSGTNQQQAGSSVVPPASISGAGAGFSSAQTATGVALRIITGGGTSAASVQTSAGAGRANKTATGAGTSVASAQIGYGTFSEAAGVRGYQFPGFRHGGTIAPSSRGGKIPNDHQRGGIIAPSLRSGRKAR